jgi:hypothetical protein
MFAELMRPLSIVLFLVIVSSQAAVSGQTTRAEIIEKQRADKAAKLETYKPGRLEKILINAEDGKLKRLVAPYNGFYVGYGYSYKPTGSGFAVGGGFRHDLFDRRARIVFEAGQSYRNYNMVRGDFSLPRLAQGRLEAGVEGVYRRQPQDDYFGPGPDSREQDRVSYLYKDTEVNGRAILTLKPWFHIGTRAGRIAPDIGSGTDDLIPSIEALFDDEAAPGLNEQPAFLFGEGFAEIDYRDEPGHTRAGGHYTLSLRGYSDRDLDQYGFRAVDMRLQQFIPIFDKKRVFAFQLVVSGSDATNGGRVPFYMHPTLGGGQTLRSERDYRFRDTHMVLMNAEYRWEAFSALDMALFTDWGKVAPKFSALDFSDLEHAYGIGFRVVAAQNVIFRLDIATGGSTGIRYMFKFNRVF